MKIACIRFWKNANDYQNLSGGQSDPLSTDPIGRLQVSMPDQGAVSERSEPFFRSQRNMSTRSAFALAARSLFVRRGTASRAGVRRRLTRSASMAVRSILLFFEPHGWHEVCWQG